MTDAKVADAGAVGQYKLLIASAAQHELYGTSESLLRAASQSG